MESGLGVRHATLNLDVAFHDFAFFILLKRVSYLLIFVIQENKIFISLICEPLFFPFVNCVRDPLYDPLVALTVSNCKAQVSSKEAVYFPHRMIP